MSSVAMFVLTGALDDTNQEQRDMGIQAGVEWYAVAEKCVSYVDHGISQGMQMGMAAAQEAGVPIEVRELFPTQQENTDEHRTEK